MKIAASKIEGVHGNSKDVRPFTHYVHLDTDKRRVIATNGHMLVILPAEIEDGDTAGPITDDALKLARKLAGRKADDITVRAGKDTVTLDDGTIMPRLSADTYTYPDVDAVVPGRSEVAVSFNPEYLALIAKALPKAEFGVTLYLKTEADGSIDPHGAIRVESNRDDNAVGVLMPVRR